MLSQIAKTALTLAGTSVNDPACPFHPLRLMRQNIFFGRGRQHVSSAFILWRLGEVQPAPKPITSTLKQVGYYLLIFMLPRSSPYRPASQSPSDVRHGGGDLTSLPNSPRRPSARHPTTQTCSALNPPNKLPGFVRPHPFTFTFYLSVKTVKEALTLTSRQWQTPRTMVPAGILFEEIAPTPNSSSPAFRASQINRRVFTATKLPSLPATLRELWHRVLVSGFVMGENKATGDARYCGHCERTYLTSSDRHFESITCTFALCLCPLASSVWALVLSWWYRRTQGQGRFWCLHHRIWSGWASLVSETLRLHLPRAPSLQTRLLLLISRSRGTSSGAAYCKFSPTRGIVYAFSHPHLWA